MKLREIINEQQSLDEGLILGKKSDKIFDYIKRLEDKLDNKDLTAQQVNMLKGLIADAKKAATAHKKVEDLYAKGTMTKVQAKLALEKAGEAYSKVLDKVKSYRKKQVMKGVAGGMIVLALVGLDKIFTSVKQSIETAKQDQNIERVIKEEA